MNRPNKQAKQKTAALIQGVVLIVVLSLFTVVGMGNLIGLPPSSCDGHTANCDPGTLTCAVDHEYCQIPPNALKYIGGGPKCSTNTVLSTTTQCGSLMQKTAGSNGTNCDSPAGKCGGTAPDSDCSQNAN